MLNLTLNWYLVLYMLTWNASSLPVLDNGFSVDSVSDKHRFRADVYVIHSLFMLLVRREIGWTKYSLFNFLCYWYFPLRLKTYQPRKIYEVLICTCSLPIIFLSTFINSHWNKRKQSLFVKAKKASTHLNIYLDGKSSIFKLQFCFHIIPSLQSHRKCRAD